MVSIAPNQFMIEGTITGKQTDGELAHHVSLMIRLDKVKHLQGPEEFLDPAQKEIEVSAQNATTESLAIGMQISCKIRKAPGRFFILPDSIQVDK